MGVGERERERETMQILPSCSIVSVSPRCVGFSKGGYKAKKVQDPLPKDRHVHLKLLKNLIPPLMTALLAFSPVGYIPDSLGQTVDVQRGVSLFGKACIGCHVGGGNILQPGATLFLKDLHRNGVDSDEEIFRITYYGKGRMPGFGENCTPRGQCTFGARLQDEDIKLLAEFVKLQADQGWPNLEPNQ